MNDEPPVKVANVASALEADLIVARLEEAGIRALARGNDTVGIFGAGFAGPSSRGVDILVRADQAEAAREVLAGEGGEG